MIYSEGVCSLIDKQYVLNDINLMSRKLKMVALGAHDTNDKSLLLVEKEFAGELKSVRVGKKITIN
tara:strand:+ start:319 stop:516 length:198 start_codon:yes stop_codon:yes gene_type:complete